MEARVQVYSFIYAILEKKIWFPSFIPEIQYSKDICYVINFT